MTLIHILDQPLEPQPISTLNSDVEGKQDSFNFMIWDCGRDQNPEPKPHWSLEALYYLYASGLQFMGVNSVNELDLGVQRNWPSKSDVISDLKYTSPKSRGKMA